MQKLEIPSRKYIRWNRAVELNRLLMPYLAEFVSTFQIFAGHFCVSFVKWCPRFLLSEAPVNILVDMVRSIGSHNKLEV